MGVLLTFVTPDLIGGPAIPGGSGEGGGTPGQARGDGVGGEPCAGMTEDVEGLDVAG